MGDRTRTWCRYLHHNVSPRLAALYPSSKFPSMRNTKLAWLGSTAALWLCACALSHSRPDGLNFASSDSTVDGGPATYGFCPPLQPAAGTRCQTPSSASLGPLCIYACTGTISAIALCEDDTWSVVRRQQGATANDTGHCALVEQRAPTPACPSMHPMLAGTSCGTGGVTCHYECLSSDGEATATCVNGRWQTEGWFTDLRHCRMDLAQSISCPAVDPGEQPCPVPTEFSGILAPATRCHYLGTYRTGPTSASGSVNRTCGTQGLQ